MCAPEGFRRGPLGNLFGRERAPLGYTEKQGCAQAQIVLNTSAHFLPCPDPLKEMRRTLLHEMSVRDFISPPLFPSFIFARSNQYVCVHGRNTNEKNKQILCVSFRAQLRTRQRAVGVSPANLAGGPWGLLSPLASLGRPASTRVFTPECHLQRGRLLGAFLRGTWIR